MNEIIVRYQDLPVSVKSFTLTDENDDYNIYINSNLDTFQQREAYNHELLHIKNNHFYRDTTAAIDEADIKNETA